MNAAALVDFVHATERALVRLATAGTPIPTHEEAAAQYAALGAIASRFMAVGTPQSFAFVGVTMELVPMAKLVLAAHRVYFALPGIRVLPGGALGESVAAELGAMLVDATTAWASDIVCCLTPVAFTPDQVRGGTHVIMPEAPPAPPGPNWLCAHFDNTQSSLLAQMTAGIIDGRQADEISVCGITLAADA